MYVNLDQLNSICQSCTNCKLHQTRTNVVFGQGDAKASLMFIGEGPGSQEDLTGIPFVGKSGQLLDKIFEAIDITRDDIYIANIVKCRPPGNRNPMEQEMCACMPYLRHQVKLIHPRIIVCLGRVAAQKIIRPDFRITKEHGIWTERKGYWLMATYHPSALLRDPSKKKDAWEDFKKIKAKLEEFIEVS